MHSVKGLNTRRAAVILACVLPMLFTSYGFGADRQAPNEQGRAEAPRDIQTTPTTTVPTGSTASGSVPVEQPGSAATPAVQNVPAAPIQHNDEIASSPTATVPDQLRPTPDSRSGASHAPMAGDKQDRSGGGMITKDETLTLDQCLDIALKKSPSIVAAFNTVEVSRNKVGEARSSYYPQLSASGGYGRTKPLNSDTNQTTAYNQYTGTVSVNQTIYDFGRTSSSVDISKSNLDSSRSDLDAAQSTIILSVKQTYYAVLQAKRNRDVAADVIKQFQLHLDQANGFYQVGTKAKIDVIKAQVDLSNAKLSLINAENALKIAWVNLNNAMGVPDAPEYSIEDNLEFKPYAITLDEATQKAFDNRPDLKSAIAKRQAGEENVSLQRSDYLPTLSGSASYSRVGTPENLPVNQSPNTWTAGVTLTFPLFSGFLTSHRVAEAKANLYVLRANEEALRQQILLDVRQAFLNLQAAAASISTTELTVKQAKENLDLANGRYAAGVGSPVEVSDAFATYVTAQANYTGALYNYKTAQATIEKAMGER
jgi:outer membrane protein